MQVFVLATALILGAEERATRSDLEGVWDFRTATPLERPRSLGDQAVFTAEEAAAFERQILERRAENLRRNPSVHPPFWLDYGTRVQPDLRTSLVVEPSSGRVPALTALAKARLAERRARQSRVPAGPEDRSLWERCLVGFNAGPPLNPGAYNNNLRIVVTDDHVVLATEMVHQARIVPIGERNAQPSEIRPWQGSSWARYEGNSLVVETTGFDPRTSFAGSGPHLRLVERFTTIDRDTLLYRYTVDDSESFAQPWSVEIRMSRGGPIHEYACHEGNRSLLHILKAARRSEGR